MYTHFSDRPIHIGYCLSLTGPVADNSRSAQLAHDIWQENINRRGGLLGRQVKLVRYDDTSDASQVGELYERLLKDDKVELVIGGYGTNTVVPALNQIAKQRRFFVGLMALGANNQLDYPGYFAMIPTGSNPNSALTEGFFELASMQKPKPATVALLAADAEFSKNPLLGARENAEKFGFAITSEHRYSLSTYDFAPLLAEVAKEAPDVVFLCTYLADSIALVQALNVWDYVPKMVGGAMIGPQNAVVKTTLGPLLNGLVNYEYWLPVPEMQFHGVKEFMDQYQSRAAKVGVDELGFYMAPLAYAQMQVIEQAIKATGSLTDDVLINYATEATFQTVVGDVKFGKHGEWSTPRVLQVQFQNITSNDISEFKDPTKQVIVSPQSFTSGKFIYPLRNAKR